MKLDFILSAIVHAVLIIATVVSSPFDKKKTLDFDEVIRVSLTAQPMPAVEEPVAVTPPSTPEPVIEELPDIPVSDPTTQPKAEVPEKPKPKPEKPKQKPPVKNNKNAAKPEGDGKIESPQTAAGSPFAGATIDNASFDYPYWFTQAFNKIRSNWRNPVSAGYTVTCTVNFQVIKSGRLIEVKVIESSGITQFDQACVNAIERAAPFPPLPHEFTDEIIGITLPFQYKP
ncbi:MAG: TonB family protein [bacterium]|nr:TonB family protein [bacterium]